MSKLKPLEKLYPRLTPDERLTLLLEALERMDEVEIRRLMDTCPSFSYTMLDVAFIQKKDAILLVASIFTIQWLRALQNWKLACQGLEGYLDSRRG